jgi:hypothetical protein
MRLRRAASQARALWDAAGRAARAHGGSRTRAAIRARRLRVRGHWEYEEALRTGLLDPRLPMREAERYASKHTTHELTRRLNPPTQVTVTDEKAMFYRVAAAIGIPTPELYGIVGRAGGWSAATGRVLSDREDAVSFLRSEVPDEVVVKPSAGYHGFGVRVLRREGADLVDLEGRRSTVRALVAELWEDPDWDLYVVQERLRNHADLQRASASPVLQTLRVTTFVAEDGTVQCVHAGLKVARGRGNVDNYRGGANGNALAEVDLATGRIAALRTPRPDGCGVIPAGGGDGRVEGIVLPGWTAVLDLARESALRLLPQRTMGWDIALTDRGPLVVEANHSYDPWPTAGFGDVVRAMRRALASGGRAEAEGVV